MNRLKKIIIAAFCLMIWGLVVHPPVSGGKLTSIWGPRFFAGRLFHPGSDIAHKTGTPVHPVAIGKIKETGFNERHGNFIKISHLPGIETRYLHLDQISSETGQRVNYLTVIGTVGNTGTLSTGPHIHFEIRLAGIPLPAFLLCLPGRILQKAGVY